MAKYSFLTYKTAYSVKCATINFDCLDSGEACFYRAFQNAKGIAEYKIKVFKGNKQAEENSYDNNCFLTREQIKEHMSHIKDIVDFKMIINDKGEYFEIKLKLNCSNVKQRFILTWLRYCYEFPGNFITMYMFKMKKYFPKLTHIDLFHLIEQGVEKRMFCGHSFRDSGSVLLLNTKEEIKRGLAHANWLQKAFKSKFEAGGFKIEKTANLDTEDKWEAFYRNGDMLDYCKHNYKLIKE